MISTRSPESELTLQRARKLADLLDSSFRVPGTPWKFGLDPLLGLIPGVGDAVGAAASFWIFYQARKLGVSKSLQFRMLANIALDGVVGSIPLVGDLWDAAFKANQRNLRLMEHFVSSKK